jgi:hypothetical protein
MSDPKASPEEPRHHAFTANMTLGYRILKTIMVSPPCEDPSGRCSAGLRASKESNKLLININNNPIFSPLLEDFVIFISMIFVMFFDELCHTDQLWSPFYILVRFSTNSLSFRFFSRKFQSFRLLRECSRCYSRKF